MSKTTTTTSKPNANKAKADKPKLSPLQTSILASLKDTADKVKALEVDCPTFTPSDAVKLLRSHKMDAQADKIEADERKAFDKEHGDAETSAKRAFRELLNAEFKSLLDAAGLNVSRKASANSDGGERKDRVVLSDEQKDEMRKERAEGAQLSKLAEKYNVSNPTAFNICKGVVPTVAK